MEACSNGIGIWFYLPGGQGGSSGRNEGRLLWKRKSANDTDKSGIPQKEVYRQDSSSFPLAKLVVIQWSWLLMLKVSQGIGSQAQKMFLGPSQKQATWQKRAKRSGSCHQDSVEGGAEVCQLGAQRGKLNTYQPAVWEHQEGSFFFQISPCSPAITENFYPFPNVTISAISSLSRNSLISDL